MTTATQAELEDAARELDGLIADETVRARHIRLVRVRAAVGRVLDAVVTPGDGDSE